LKVLVIGGGDGYVVSEVLKHKTVSTIDHVELDEGVIEASKRYFDWARDLWDDDRVHLHVRDGSKFLVEMAIEVESSGTIPYDVIIQDSADPFVVEEDGVTITTLPSAVLYSPDHFSAVFRSLNPESGVFLFQAETYNVRLKYFLYLF